VSEAKRPRLSIGLPLYNGEPYLAESVDSLLDQTFTDFELIISDNASTDNSEAICRAYAAKDARVRYVRQPRNMGGFWNHSHVIELARGDFFMWSAHDDIREPDYCRRCMEVLDERPEVVLCYSETRNIDEDGKELDAREVLIGCDLPDTAPRFAELIRMDHRIEPTYGLVRMDVLSKTGLAGDFADSDRVLLAELALHGPFHRIPEKLFRRRDHAARSIRVHTSRHDRARWIHPDATPRITFPYFRELGEYAKAIRRAKPPLPDALGCWGQLGRWVVKHRALLVGDLRYAAKELLRPLFRRRRGDD
jgi:glycosyltransferase involved in cell wall biosynthesis